MSDNNQDIPLVKIAFQDLDGQIESLWASELSENRFQLNNSPWFQYGLSYMDIIEAFPSKDGLPEFCRVIEKSGHRTIRFILEHEDKTLLESIKAADCTFEGAYSKVFALDIPPGVDIENVLDILEEHKVYYEIADPEPKDPEQGC